MLATIRRRRLLAPEASVLVALSGGPDSTALLGALAALAAAGKVGKVFACHVDHGLRPGSDADALACAELCRRLSVPMVGRKVQVARGNVQAEARRARYAALREAAAAEGCERVATGHTRTDQAETVLLRLLRGSGARGLSAIPPRRGAIVRPLIDRSRAEVLEYLRARALPWLEDPSNATGRYLRNRLRLSVWPELARLAPGAERALARAADLLRGDERALDAQARTFLAGSGCASPPAAALIALRAAPPAVRRRVVRRLWMSAAGSRRGLQADHVESLLGLVRRGRGGPVALPGGFEGRAASGVLEIAPASGRPAPPREGARPPAVEVTGPGVFGLEGRPERLVISAGAAGDGCLRLRAGSVGWPLELRTRRPGDRFRPRGGRGSKKLKSWLIDRKVPLAERDELLLLAERGGRVLWIPGLGVEAAALDVGPGPLLAVRLETPR